MNKIFASVDKDLLKSYPWDVMKCAMRNKDKVDPGMETHPMFNLIVKLLCSSAGKASLPP